MADKDGSSRPGKDFWGNDITEHFDSSGTKTGESRSGTDFFGNSRVEHFDTSGTKTGESRSGTDLFGSPKTDHFDTSGRRSGESRNGTDFLGNPKTDHFDRSGHSTGESRLTTDFFGNTIQTHTGTAPPNAMPHQEGSQERSSTSRQKADSGTSVSPNSGFGGSGGSTAWCTGSSFGEPHEQVPDRSLGRSVAAYWCGWMAILGAALGLGIRITPILLELAGASLVPDTAHLFSALANPQYPWPLSLAPMVEASEFSWFWFTFTCVIGWALIWAIIGSFRAKTAGRYWFAATIVVAVLIAPTYAGRHFDGAFVALLQIIISPLILLVDLLGLAWSQFDVFNRFSAALMNGVCLGFIYGALLRTRDSQRSGGRRNLWIVIAIFISLFIVGLLRFRSQMVV